MKNHIITCLALILITAYADAEWIQHKSPYYGYIDAVRVHQSNSNCLFAFESGDVYKSDDAGDNWYTCLESDYSNIFDLAPSNNDIIYTEEWKSIDAGESWFSIDTIPHGNYGVSVPRYQIAIHPNNPDTVFSAVRSSLIYTEGIYRTLNGGVSWELVAELYNPLPIVYDNDTPSILYAFGVYRVYTSTNGGEDWTEVYNNSSEPNFGLKAVVHDHNIYVLRGSAPVPPWGSEFISVSSDQGVSWTELTLSPLNYDITVVSDFLVDISGIYATTDNGLYRSIDNGQTWDRISRDCDYLESLDVNNNNIYIASNALGVSVASINSENWRNIGIFSNVGYNSLLISSPSGHTIWTSNYHAAIYKYNPVTDYWYTIIPPNCWSSNDYAIGFSPDFPDRLFCLCNEQLFSSDDAGESWDFIANVPEDYFNSSRLMISSDEQKMFALTNDDNILRTLNGGASWSTRSCPGGYINDWHYSSERTLYVCDESDFYFSINDGNTWSEMNSGLPLDRSWLSMNSDSNDDDKLYCSLYSSNLYKLFKKESGATTWQFIYSTPPDYSIMLGSNIAVDPISSDLYLAQNVFTGGQYNVGLYRSTDGGSSWEICCDQFDFFSCDDYTFAIYEPYNMWYVDSQGDFWTGDVQNMTNVNKPADNISPSEFSLSPAYPNPFNPATKFTFTLPVAGDVSLSVYDISGRTVGKLIDGNMNAGLHEIAFDGSGLSSGVYFSRLQAGDFCQTRKIILLK